MPETYKIMLVDDEESIKRVIEEIVIKEGYQFCYAANGETALKMFRKENPSLVILDVMLPETDGFQLCKIIRETSIIPIIILSAKGDVVDKSVGFMMGADDYVSKPFSPVELSFRIKALLRRSNNYANCISPDLKPAESDQVKIIEGDLEINPNEYEVRIQGKKVELTPKEFELLSYMASRPGQVFTRDQICNKLWREEYSGDPGSITVFIRRIREKIEENPARPQYIVTVWGVGYKFCN